MIAMALACDPQLLIADEPTTVLDVTTQAQVLTVLRDVQKTQGIAMLCISHDLDAVLAMADRVAVMRNGDLLEQGSAQAILHAPQHAYTRPLTNAYKRRASGYGQKHGAQGISDRRQCRVRQRSHPQAGAHGYQSENCTGNYAGYRR